MWRSVKIQIFNEIRIVFTRLGTLLGSAFVSLALYLLKVTNPRSVNDALHELMNDYGIDELAIH